jgi:seryl-tRNA synthetase
MLEIKYIRENREEVIGRLLVRGRDYTDEINCVIELGDKRRELKKKLDDVRHQRKILAQDYNTRQ